MPQHAILEKMLDRLYASLMRGPGLNCRPHSSRQRVDVTKLDGLGSSGELGAAAEVLSALLGPDGAITIPATLKRPAWMPPPSGRWNRAPKVEFDEAAEVDDGLEPEERARRKAAEKAWNDQRALLTKLRNLSEDAKTYEQDTGVHALSIGYGVLSLPPGVASRSGRVLAPIAFIPVTLAVRTGAKAGIEIRTRGAGVDLVTPNMALLAWLERETGERIPELFEDDEGTAPWQEIQELVRIAVERTGIESVDLDAWGCVPTAPLRAIPKSDELPPGAALLPGVVIGLFPASNQGLIRDTRALIDAPELDGPVESFVDVNVQLVEDEPIADETETEEAAIDTALRSYGEERFVARADPFQAEAVRRARSSTGLVIHGPPGTGKSQTITNIIGDHLARGERVLFVCDKRTALDVVANRLEAMGMAHLCALVHDSKRDQRRLYMGIRAALDELTDTTTDKGARGKLRRVDRELETLSTELRSVAAALGDPVGDGPSFHDLVGGWLGITTPHVEGLDATAVDLPALESSERDLGVLIQRGSDVAYPINPWSKVAGTNFDAFLGRRQDELRRELASLEEDARAADATAHETIPPFDEERPLAVQAAARTELIVPLREVLETVSITTRARVAGMDAAALERGAKQLAAAADARALLTEPLDGELALVTEGAVIPVGDLNTAIADLDRYIDGQSRWYRFLLWGRKRTAGKVLRPYGLAVSLENAQRVHLFLRGLRARLLAKALVRELAGADAPLPANDTELVGYLDHAEATIRLVRQADTDEVVPAVVRSVLTGESDSAALLDGLERSAPRAQTVTRFTESLAGIDLFHAEWQGQVDGLLRQGRTATSTITDLISRFDTLEGVLRVRTALDALPPAIAAAARCVLSAGLDPEEGLDALRRHALSRAIEARLAEDETLRRLDGRRLEDALARFVHLEGRKRGLVRDVILHEWTERQKERLLAGTRSRLGSAGAALRRRLFVRGQRAMRLRQMIAAGVTDDEQGDPLFDMCPVWMASPETVAQVFPREELFDVVVFDEASQLRLEEALPVLTRAKRAVIAGDPKQLPPTRFFEAGISTSETGELETEQDLFEAQQGEVEDLLAAALNLDIDEAYLDVHYRSSNADLISFSNKTFYGGRLQAVPGHPRNRTRIPPIRLVPVDGLYDKRGNAQEAQQVVDIVDGLLKRAEPPSIGIACFNLVQRDMIRDMLDERAQEDDEFARRLSTARELRREGSFEGLFVKNLESVQGDERDHIIVSTTYGPNREGKFYRRFGPLGMRGGGRRLNVLVTRARDELHLVTSIPREVYLSAEPVPAGKRPSGGWLLFAYLRHAEYLADLYQQANERWDNALREGTPRVNENPIAPVSEFAHALGQRLTDELSIGSDVHWGNAGFCVDAALHDPEHAEDVTAGLLCDFTRYDRAPDRVAWEVFRTELLAGQGWSLHRVWTPTFFRDRRRVLAAVKDAAEAARSNRPTTS